MRKKICGLFLFFCFAGTGYVFPEPLKIPHPESFKTIKRSSEDFKAIKKIFSDLIEAAQEGDIKKIMNFFSKNYLNSGRNHEDVKKQWETIIKHFSDLELSHPVYQIEKSGVIGKIRCRGVISGVPKTPGIAESEEESVVVDQWNIASHNVIKEDGKWKILGDQIPFDAGRAFHPLF